MPIAFVIFHKNTVLRTSCDDGNYLDICSPRRCTVCVVILVSKKNNLFYCTKKVYKLYMKTNFFKQVLLAICTVGPLYRFRKKRTRLLVNVVFHCLHRRHWGNWIHICLSFLFLCFFFILFYIYFFLYFFDFFIKVIFLLLLGIALSVHQLFPFSRSIDRVNSST